MKKPIILLLICALCTMMPTNSTAQGNSAKAKAKKEQAEKMKAKGKDKVKKIKDTTSEAGEQEEGAIEQAEGMKGKGKDKAKEMKIKGNDKAKEMKEKGKSKKEEGASRGDDYDEGDMDEMEDKGPKKDKKEKSNNGNAYGKNKGDLEGKAFGAERARLAKERKAEKAKDLEQTINKGTEKSQSARERVQAAKEKLEQDRKAGKVDEAGYKMKKEKIEAAEQALADLEEKVKKGKAKRNRE